jgi:hypothetical protein
MLTHFNKMRHIIYLLKFFKKKKKIKLISLIAAHKFISTVRTKYYKLIYFSIKLSYLWRISWVAHVVMLSRMLIMRAKVSVLTKCTLARF